MIKKYSSVFVDKCVITIVMCMLAVLDIACLYNCLWMHVLLVFAIMASGMLLCFLKNGIEMNYGLILVAMGFLYVTGPIIALIVGQLSKDDVWKDLWLVYFSAFSCFFFSLGYSFCIERKKTKSVEKHLPDKNKYNHVMLKFILLIGTGIFFLTKIFILSKIGIYSYLTLGRAATKKIIVSNFGWAPLIDSVSYVLMVFALEMHYEKKRETKDLFYL